MASHSIGPANRCAGVETARSRAFITSSGPCVSSSRVSLAVALRGTEWTLARHGGMVLLDMIRLRRQRPVYAALTAGTVVLGLLSRRIPALPAWLAKDAGDVLYATMVFWLVGLLAPALPTRSAAVAAVAFCFAIELSQLYHAPWIDAIRDTRLGGLVLGHGLHATDLVCYGIGVVLGVLIERAWLLRV
jgi:hypothetical protein